MLRQFRYILPETEHRFPLSKNELGFFEAVYTRQGHNLRCPHCGASVWTLKGYQEIKCIACLKEYDNLGVLGLRERQ